MKINRIIIILIFINISLCLCETPKVSYLYPRIGTRFPGRSVGGIALDSSGYKWLGTDIGVTKSNESSWVSYDSSSIKELKQILYYYRYNNINISEILVDANNKKWFGGIGGLASFDDNKWLFYDTTNSLIPCYECPFYATILSLGMDKDNSIWMDAAGIIKFNQKENKWTKYDSTNSPIKEISFDLILCDKNNAMWFLPWQRNKVYKLKDTTWTIFEGQSIPTKSIFDIAIDKYNNKWFSSGAGVLKFDDTTWTIYDKTNGLPAVNGLWFIAVESDSIIWLETGSSVNSTLVSFDGKQWKVYNNDNIGLKISQIGKIFIDKNHNKWIDCGSHFTIFNENGIVGPLDVGDGWVQSDTFEEVSIYPNPFSSGINITFNTGAVLNANITIYNMIGEVVLIKENGPGDSAYFDGGSLPPGVYLCRIVMDGKVITKKIVKM